MRFSTTVEYVLHGLTYRGKAPTDKSVLTSEIGKGRNVPEASPLKEAFVEGISSQDEWVEI